MIGNDSDETDTDPETEKFPPLQPEQKQEYEYDSSDNDALVNDEYGESPSDDSEDEKVESEGLMVGMTLMGQVTNNMDDGYSGLREWLESIGLEKYLENFVVNGYESVDFIPEYHEMNETNNLKDIVDNKQDYDKLMAEIKKIQRKIDDHEHEYDTDEEDMIFNKGKGITMMGMVHSEQHYDIDINVKCMTLMGSPTNGMELKESDEDDGIGLIKGVVLRTETENGDTSDIEKYKDALDNHHGRVKFMGHAPTLDCVEDKQICNGDTKENKNRNKLKEKLAKMIMKLQQQKLQKNEEILLLDEQTKQIQALVLDSDGMDRQTMKEELKDITDAFKIKREDMRFRRKFKRDNDTDYTKDEPLLSHGITLMGVCDENEIVQ